MSSSLELFNMFVKDTHPNFYTFSHGHVAFCADTKCHKCLIIKECRTDALSLIPKLTPEEFIKVIEANPEYAI
jgi:hypothetical protein